MDTLHKIGRAGFLILFMTALLFGGYGKETVRDVSRKNEDSKKEAASGSGEAKVDFFAMDTYITFTAYDGTDAKEALKKAEDRMAELESEWSVTDEDSEIYKVNHSGGKPVTVSSETAQIISYALDMAEKTEGALEPTIYPVLTAWGFTTDENRIPGDEELKALLSRVDYKRVRLSDNQVILPEGMELDLGAVGKGYAADVVTGFLKDEGITSALLDLGGNIQTIGRKPSGEGWRLGIRNPFGEGALSVLSVSGDTAVVTSGSYERYFVGDDGKEYGHIIDPVTGYPVENELASVTIIAKEGKLADALSTSMLVKGLKGAADYWRENEDFDMIAVTDDGKIYLTEGIKDTFSLSGTFANMKMEILER